MLLTVHNRKYAYATDRLCLDIWSVTDVQQSKHYIHYITRITCLYAVCLCVCCVCSWGITLSAQKHTLRWDSRSPTLFGIARRVRWRVLCALCCSVLLCPLLCVVWKCNQSNKSLDLPQTTVPETRLLPLLTVHVFSFVFIQFLFWFSV